MPVQIPESGLHRPYAKIAGTEPLPGYTLLEPLGRGGFGEVWKCVAPGGLLKAVKFVAPSGLAGEGNELRQELAAFEQIKSIRHPFLLTLERVELVDEELVMVMELADCQLQDRFRKYVEAGQHGIPRDELLGYLADAAEALDVISSKFSLQHLDVKPANLFITSGRVKVGDYGLVSRLEAGKSVTEESRGLTPKYVAPEVLRGAPSPRSDQYSLALVYQELLTGKFPYTSRNQQHMMLQHLTTEPDLEPLPACDRGPVGRALAKAPEERFANCLEFIGALLTADAGNSPSLAIRKARLDRGVLDPSVLTDRHPQPADPASLTGRHPAQEEPTQNVTLPPASKTAPQKPVLPPLVAAGSRRPTTPVATPPPKKPEEELPLVGAAEESPAVKLDRIRSVVPIIRLHGPHWTDIRLDGRGMVAALVSAAAGGKRIPEIGGDFSHEADGTWSTRFPTTVSAQVAPLKLITIGEYWGTSVEVDGCKIVMRKLIAGSLWSSFSGKKKSGLEIVVAMPNPGPPVGEVELQARLIGTPDTNFVRGAQELIPNILTGIRRELANVQDRRKHQRVLTDLKATVFPLHGNGRVRPPLPGHCLNVSLGGICFTTAHRIPTSYAYLAFESVPEIDGHAVLVQLVRNKPESPAQEHVAAGLFRTEL